MSINEITKKILYCFWVCFYFIKASPVLIYLIVKREYLYAKLIVYSILDTIKN